MIFSLKQISLTPLLLMKSLSQILTKSNLVVDKHFDDEHFVDREHLETKHFECQESKVFYGQPIFDEYTSDGDERIFL
jgi:hypothetical protein